MGVADLLYGIGVGLIIAASAIYSNGYSIRLVEKLIGAGIASMMGMFYLMCKGYE